MDAKQIEAELAVVSEKLTKLKQQMANLEEWERKLHAALDVAAVLDGTPSARTTANGEMRQDVHTVVRTTTVNDRTGAVTKKTYGRNRPLATGLPGRAGQALIEMLREKGDFIKPLDAVARLKAERGIQIGLGKPGRETSDLSAAIGHGRVPGLVVTRKDGWGLEEWSGIPPVQREQGFFTKTEKESPTENDAE